MLKTWTIKEPHIKGTTFNERKITFPFDITNCKIDMHFKQNILSKPVFYWSTIGNSFEKISSTEIKMKSCILDFPVGNYLADLQVTYQDGTIYPYFKASLQIIQNITTPTT